MEQRTLQYVNNYLNTIIYSYLETSGGQSSSLYLNVVHFSTPELIRHLWQLKTIVFPALMSNMRCSITYTIYFALPSGDIVLLDNSQTFC
jgi:hypothetical protein